ncbi:hypothetical protein A8F94_16715 [Bacillus sp. FJAT-27225]|uniref:DUF1878 family protein n=1 Tax=Bacillus sp. FJAT-27225 TaxID=1743144 RepID=UPI00080C212E|nr:DUF1878 family protein [Bacillus sp. FJAT-27225]OCA84349.1 hypothetical protein A8F94_16715 [Bacillus sp. FJAT-27225]
MESRDLLERIQVLEYHMRLLAEAVEKPEYELNKLLVKRNVAERETAELFDLCERLSKLMEEQKAEGFLHFHPLFEEFAASLSSKLNPSEVVNACMKQKIFIPLMNEFKKFT